MTEETASQAASVPDGETLPPATSQESAAIPTAKKSSPRRKVASRVKTAHVTEAAETDGAMVKKTVKARKPRAKAATAVEEDNSTKKDAAADGPTATPEPPAQAELLSPAAFTASLRPETHIETQVILPDAYRAPEEKTAQTFGRDRDGSQEPKFVASEQAPSPAATPPTLEEVPPPSSSDVATNAPLQPTQGRQFEQQGPRGDHRPFQGRQDRFDRPQQGGNRHDRRDRPPQGGQYPNDRPPQGQYGNDRQGGGQYNNDRQGGGQYNNDRQGGGQFNRNDRRDRNDRGDRGNRGDGQFNPGPISEEGNQPGGDTVVSRPTEVQFGEGIVEVSGKGFGFLREAKRSFVQTPADIFVTPEVCRKYNLRDGQWIKGEVRRSSRGPQLFRLTQLNGEEVDGSTPRSLPNFDELTSINPKKRIKLETVPERYTTRVMDLMTPIGKGQRGLIVAPPRTGKTTLLQHIGEAVVTNHPDMKLIILLVDERPEEVTEIRRSVPQAEIMASSNDSDLKSHTRIAQLAMERCKRLVEAGQHVFMLLDSITRMARAFNNTMSGNRGTQSGGLSVGALEIPRKIFAAARNTEEAGSLTIMATALIETNSKMDDAIFQEFKGTGNMELVLDRKISDQRIYPAVDIFLSGTRREELLLQPWELDKINVIRRGLAGHKAPEAIERLLSFLKKFPTNAQMLMSLPG